MNRNILLNATLLAVISFGLTGLVQAQNAKVGHRARFMGTSAAVLGSG